MTHDAHDHAYHPDRRQVLRTWLPPLAASGLLAAAGVALGGREGRHRPQDAPTTPPARPRDWRVEGAKPLLAAASGEGPEVNLRRALAAVGGIGAFVRRGEKVAVKPNCAWDRTPEQAANTNPELVAELVRQCLEAGAAQVTVLDNTCHDPDRSFARSGIGPAAAAAGARVLHQGNAGTVLLDLGGTVLGHWEVLTPLVEADRVINVPIVKHHSLGILTLGMKNWFGAIVGRRGNLHQQLPRVCAELGAALRPTLTVVDATRVMISGGPTGGSLELVRTLDRIAVATDPVAADAWAAEQMDVAADRLSYLALAEGMGLGASDWRSLEVAPA